MTALSHGSTAESLSFSFFEILIGAPLVAARTEQENDGANQRKEPDQRYRLKRWAGWVGVVMLGVGGQGVGLQPVIGIKSAKTNEYRKKTNDDSTTRHD